MRRRFTRFNKQEYFDHNMKIVDQLKAIAAKKNVTPAQLTLAWVTTLGPKVVPIPGSSCVDFSQLVANDELDCSLSTAKRRA